MWRFWIAILVGWASLSGLFFGWRSIAVKEGFNCLAYYGDDGKHLIHISGQRYHYATTILASNYASPNQHASISYEQDRQGQIHLVAYNHLASQRLELVRDIADSNFWSWREDSQYLALGWQAQDGLHYLAIINPLGEIELKIPVTDTSDLFRWTDDGRYLVYPTAKDITLIDLATWDHHTYPITSSIIRRSKSWYWYHIVDNHFVFATTQTLYHIDLASYRLHTTSLPPQTPSQAADVYWSSDAQQIIYFITDEPSVFRLYHYRLENGRFELVNDWRFLGGFGGVHGWAEEWVWLGISQIHEERPALYQLMLESGRVDFRLSEVGMVQDGYMISEVNHTPEMAGNGSLYTIELSTGRQRLLPIEGKRVGDTRFYVPDTVLSYKQFYVPDTVLIYKQGIRWLNVELGSAIYRFNYRTGQQWPLVYFLPTVPSSPPNLFFHRYDAEFHVFSGNNLASALFFDVRQRKTFPPPRGLPQEWQLRWYYHIPDQPQWILSIVVGSRDLVYLFDPTTNEARFLLYSNPTRPDPDDWALPYLSPDERWLALLVVPDSAYGYGELWVFDWQHLDREPMYLGRHENPFSRRLSWTKCNY